MATTTHNGTRTSPYDVTYDLRKTQNQDPSYQSAWWQTKDPEMIWQDVISVANVIEDSNRGRRETRIRHASIYSNRPIRGFGLGEHGKLGYTSSRERLSLNVVKSCVDTACSKISKNRARPIFVTSDGSYQDQQKATGLTQYCDGLFQASDVYTAGQSVFRDACIFDTGCLRIYEDSGEVKAERVLIDEILIDEDDGRDGHPRQLHHVRYIEKSVLASLFPKYKQEIFASGDSGSEKRASNLIRVYDSYHIRSGESAHDGMRAISIPDATLFHEEWDKDYLPYVFYKWTEPLSGPFGISLVEELVGIQVEINTLLRQIQRAMVGSIPRIFVDNASVVNTGAISDEMWGVIKYTGRPPVFGPTSSISPEVTQHLSFLFQKAFEITGVSMMAATSKKEVGVDAAVALRELADQATERFILKGMALENFYMEAARVMVDLTKDLYLRSKENGQESPKVKVKSGKFIETIKWADVDLDDDKYIMRVFPTSLLPTQPAGRLQTIREMLNDGFISDREEALDLLDMPDLQKMVSLKTAGLENIRWIISEILDNGNLIPPTKYMSLDMGLRLVQAELLNGQRQNRPKARLDMLQRWMGLAEDVLNADQPPPPPPGPGAGPGDQYPLPPPGVPLTPGAPGEPPIMPPPPIGLAPPPPVL